ncbi:MAG: zinc-dependent metalloprotease [Arenimonas sp.]|nr:zinc-dependent metalloprotease [Arenimonas sp.]
MRLAALVCLFSSIALSYSPLSQSAAAGEFDLSVDKASGKVQLDISRLNQPFLMVATLENAIGSNDIGLDRAANGDPLLVEFRREGKRAFLIQRNTRFIAKSNDPDEVKAVRDAFAEAVLWAGDISTNANKPGAQLIDFNSLMLNDFVGVSNRLNQTKQGSYSLNRDRSAVISEACNSFPSNAECSALLTFTGSGEGNYVKQVAADASALTVTQRISLLRLPGAGFTPRAYHPASGGYSLGYFDFAQSISNNLDVRLQPRFRLEKTDPNAARSTVVKPIVFYLDRGTPEPIRSALLEGANWWSAAFDAAGFIGGFRAEIAPPGMDMSDARYNTITWTHRATRGWSYGGGLIDPRTGEIIKGYVNLGSQRVRQDLLIAEGLLAPYRPGASPDLLTEAQQMALSRLKQLAAHEVGHALGFAHNFAASRTATGSVLDYPHPQMSIDSQGQIQMKQAYDVGLGEWDKFVVAHAYGSFAPNQEAAELAKLRADIKAKGYTYISDADARSSGDASEQGVLWDIPGDALTGLQKLLEVRRLALNNFAAGALPPNRQTGEAERRLVPIYLLHRYQAEGVIRLIGGVNYAYGLIGDSNLETTRVDARTQQQALAATKSLLSYETLSIPASVLKVMSPPSNEFERGPEYFGTQMAPVFDPLQAVEAASALVAKFSFDAERLNRLAWQHEQDANIPSVANLFDTLLTQQWQEKPSSDSQTLVLNTRNWVLLDAALLTLDGGKLHPAVASQWRTAMANLAKQLESSKQSSSQDAGRYINRYLRDPSSVKLRPLANIPPGAPI